MEETPKYGVAAIVTAPEKNTLKIRVKATGEVFNVAEWAKIPTNHYNDSCTPIEFSCDEVEFIQETASKEVDWNERRYELAKAYSFELLKAAERTENYVSYYELARQSIEFADEMVERLKKPQND